MVCEKTTCHQTIKEVTFLVRQQVSGEPKDLEKELSGICCSWKGRCAADTRAFCAAAVDNIREWWRLELESNMEGTIGRGRESHLVEVPALLRLSLGNVVANLTT